MVFPSSGLNSLDDTDWVAAREQLSVELDRFIGFELGEMFVPYGRIVGLDAYRGLLDVEAWIGAKHSSLSRVAERDRLTLRDELRPDFVVFTGNDLAIDMVIYDRIPDGAPRRPDSDRAVLANTPSSSSAWSLSCHYLQVNLSSTNVIVLRPNPMENL